MIIINHWEFFFFAFMLTNKIQVYTQVIKPAVLLIYLGSFWFCWNFSSIVFRAFIISVCQLTVKALNALTVAHHHRMVGVGRDLSRYLVQPPCRFICSRLNSSSHQDGFWISPEETLQHLWAACLSALSPTNKKTPPKPKKILYIQRAPPMFQFVPAGPCLVLPLDSHPSETGTHWRDPG